MKVFQVSGGNLARFPQFRIQDYLTKGIQDASFIHFGPFDLFSWQLIWIGGLIFGRSLQGAENRSWKCPGLRSLRCS